MAMTTQLAGTSASSWDVSWIPDPFGGTVQITNSTAGTVNIPVQFMTASQPAMISLFPYNPDSCLPIRRPPPLEFNRYINASDLMEEFIKFLGEHRVKKGQVMSLPLELFIKWLIIQACEADHEEPNVVLELPAPKKVRCQQCRRFMAKNSPLLLHGGVCAERFYQQHQTLVRSR